MSNDDVANSRNRPEAEEEEPNSEEEKEDLVQFLDEARPELAMKEKVHEWPELQEQIKEDLQGTYKQHTPAFQINQLLILRNFANL